MRLVDKIPKGWTFQRLGRFVKDLESGVSVNSSEQGGDALLRVLKTSCVSDGMFDPTEAKAVITEDERRVKCPVRAGSVIISRMNTLELVGANGYVANSDESLFLPDRLWQTVWNRNVEFDPRWLAQLLKSQMGRRFLKNIASGTSGSMKNISKHAFLGGEVPSPSPIEQNKIADILCASDSVTGKTEGLLQAKINLKRGLMQKLLPGAMRFKEFKGKQWLSFRLGELFSERVEIGRADLPLVAITGQNGVVPRDSLAKRDTSSEDKSRYLRIAPGDIGYNTMRMWQGVAGLSKIEGIVSPAYTICIPSKKIDAQFAAYLFKEAPIINLFRRYSQGLVDDTLSLKFPHFAEIHVTIPDVPEQRRIAAVLWAFDRENELLQRQLEALKEQKRGLMEGLLTGEIRVKVPRQVK